MVRWWRRRGAVGIWKSGMACLSAHLAASCFFFSFRAASLDVEDDMSNAKGAFVTPPLGTEGTTRSRAAHCSHSDDASGLDASGQGQ